MVGWDAGSTLAERFRTHAGDADHLYGHAMRAMASDWEAGGPVRAVCAGYQNARSGSAIQLRLLAGVFRLVLTGQAPQLRRFYPCLGGTEPPAGAWPVMRTVIADHVPMLRTALETDPQTNEVGRSAALLAGLFDLVAATGVHRIRLLELGASAGLNLLVDRFAFTGEGWRFGPAASPVQLADAIQGTVQPEPFTIVARRGCDLAPVDAATVDGRLLLTSFVWPFHVHRHERLAAALTMVRNHPVTVDRGAAADWLPHQLRHSDPEVLTVVWHSITRLYWPAAEVAAVETTLAEHGTSRWLGRVAMEFVPDGSVADRPEVRTHLWRPGWAPRERLIGSAHHHGLPVVI